MQDELIQNARRVMVCKRCNSENQSTFDGEIALHFPGLDGLDKPIVWVFPKLTVCLECGFTEFTVPERELRVLVTHTPVEGAVVSEDTRTVFEAKRKRDEVT
jgi:hypothetical protein